MQDFVKCKEFMFGVSTNQRLRGNAMLNMECILIGSPQYNRRINASNPVNICSVAKKGYEENIFRIICGGFQALYRQNQLGPQEKIPSLL